MNNGKYRIEGKIVNSEKNKQSYYIQVWDAGVKDQLDQNVFDQPISENNKTEDDGSFRIDILHRDVELIIDGYLKRNYEEDRSRFYFVVCDRNKKFPNFRKRKCVSTKNYLVWNPQFKKSILIDFPSGSKKRKGISGKLEDLYNEFLDMAEESAEKIFDIGEEVFFDSIIDITDEIIDKSLKERKLHLERDYIKSVLVENIKAHPDTPDILKEAVSDPKTARKRVIEIINEMRKEFTPEKSSDIMKKLFEMIDIKKEINHIASRYIPQEYQQLLSHDLGKIDLKNPESVITFLRSDILRKYVYPKYIDVVDELIVEKTGISIRNSIYSQLEKSLNEELPRNLKMEDILRYLYEIESSNPSVILDKFKAKIHALAIDPSTLKKIDNVIFEYSGTSLQAEVTNRILAVCSDATISEFDQLFSKLDDEKTELKERITQVRKFVNEKVPDEYLNLAEEILTQVMSIQIIEELKTSVKSEINKSNVENYYQKLTSLKYKTLEEICEIVKSDYLGEFSEIQSKLNGFSDQFCSVDYPETATDDQGQKELDDSTKLIEEGVEDIDVELDGSAENETPAVEIKKPIPPSIPSEEREISETPIPEKIEVAKADGEATISERSELLETRSNNDVQEPPSKLFQGTGLPILKNPIWDDLEPKLSSISGLYRDDFVRALYNIAEVESLNLESKHREELHKLIEDLNEESRRMILLDIGLCVFTFGYIFFEDLFANLKKNNIETNQINLETMGSALLEVIKEKQISESLKNRIKKAISVANRRNPYTKESPVKDLISEFFRDHVQSVPTNEYPEGSSLKLDADYKLAEHWIEYQLLQEIKSEQESNVN